MSNKINPVLLQLARGQVYNSGEPAAGEKLAFQPPGGGAPPAAPPGDPAAMGGAPPMDPAMMGGMGGAPPMDPAMMAGMAGMGGMPGMMPPGGGAVGNGAAGGKPKFDPLMLDYRMYNLQQQVSAIMNALGIEVPPQALVMPPGTMGAPPAEMALPGGPMDPSTMGQGGGGGGQSAIQPIEPMQGASPEMAQGSKMASARDLRPQLPAEVHEFLKEANANAPTGWRVIAVKAAEGTALGDVDEDPPPRKSSPPNQALNVPGAPGTRPNAYPVTAGGSKDPKSRPDTDADMCVVNKQAADFGSSLASVGAGVSGYEPPQSDAPAAAPASTVPLTTHAAATAAMLRSRAMRGSAY